MAWFDKSSDVGPAIITLSAVRKTLARYNALPQGVTGETTILGSGSPSFAGSPPGVHLLRIENLTLIFFSTPARARAGVQQIASFFVYGKGASLLAKPPPVSEASKVVWLAGNLIAVWQSPVRHAAADARVLGKCLAASRA